MFLSRVAAEIFFAANHALAKISTINSPFGTSRNAAAAVIPNASLMANLRTVAGSSLAVPNSPYAAIKNRPDPVSITFFSSFDRVNICGAQVKYGLPSSKGNGSETLQPASLSNSISWNPVEYPSGTRLSYLIDTVGGARVSLSTLRNLVLSTIRAPTRWRSFSNSSIASAARAFASATLLSSASLARFANQSSPNTPITISEFAMMDSSLSSHTFPRKKTSAISTPNPARISKAIRSAHLELKSDMDFRSLFFGPSIAA